MTRISFITVAALAVALSWGCSSSDNSNTATSNPVDSGTTVADAGEADGTTADKDAGATAADTSVVDKDAGTSTVDAGGGTADAGGTVDAGTPKPAKCASSDQMCLQNCGTNSCGTEMQACQMDLKCSKVLGCLQNCQKVPPVELPGEATHTCSQKCYENYGDSATEMFFASQLCMVSQCVAGVYTAPCSQTDAKCQNACLFDKCDAPVLECIKDKGCIKFMTCLNTQCTDPATQQACATECQQKVVTAHGQAAAQTAQLIYSKIMSCGQSSCL